MFNFRKIFKPRSTSNEIERKTVFPPALSFFDKNQELTIGAIDQHFYGQLLGVNSRVNSGLNSFEKRVIHQLEKAASNQSALMSLLPRLPLVLPKVMKALRDENTTAKIIAGIIEEDPSLVANVIRLTNSPRYKTREKITNLEQATVILGRDGLKRLVACALLKPILNVKGGHFLQLSSALLWELSENTSIVAFNLCRDSDENRFYAYLAGLLQNIGLIIGLKILDKEFDSTESPNSHQFQILFDNYCRKISSKVALNWGMPERIVEAFDSQENPKEANSPSSLHIHLFISDRIAKVQSLSDKINFDLANANIVLNGEQCFNCLEGLTAINYKTA